MPEITSPQEVYELTCSSCKKKFRSINPKSARCGKCSGSMKKIYGSAKS